MKKSFHLIIVAVLILVLHPFSLLIANPDELTNNEWIIYDINGDGKFDKVDIEEFIERGGIGFINDLNSDGNKDLTDAFALYVKLSVLDRSGNEAVDDKDFTPIDPVQLSEPDAAAVWPLVSRIVTEASVKLPADIESQVFRSIPAGRPLTPFEKAYIFEETGMSALLQLNLEGAQWAYGRAYQTNNRSATALGSLGFAIAMDKRHEEALTLLAYSRELYRESGATSTSIAWIFARHGQNDEALRFYKEAVEFAPDIAHYRMNLGIAYLRIGAREKACEEFRIAAELDPGDFHAVLFRHVVPEKVPPQQTPIDINKLKREDQLQITEFREWGATDDELPTPWDECSPCEQARKIPELLERRDNRKYTQTAQSYADEFANKLNDWGHAYAPLLEKSSEDLERWTKWRAGQKAFRAEEIEAENALGTLDASLTMQRGHEIMSYSSFFMECALQEARSEAKTMSGYIEERTKDLPVTAASRAELEAENYRDALEQAINECYRDPMLTAAGLLNVEFTPHSLPVSHVEVLDLTFFYPFVWLNLCLSKPGYYNGGDTDLPAAPYDNTFSIDLWIISFEYESDSGTWELRVGQGIILGATWSPESGFGFQAGVGGSTPGIVEIGGAAYFQVDKNGLSLNYEGGVSTGIIAKTGPEVSGGVVLIPFQSVPGEPSL